MAVVFSVCSVLMAALFGVSASVQFNDPDWYLWVPLYTFGFIVNLVNGLCEFPKLTASLAKFGFWLGLYLFIKVALEGLQNGGISEFWSLDMRERVVREKIGSGLVIASMYAHQLKPTAGENGMLLTLVVAGYGLSILFYFCHHQEMRF